MAKVGDIIRYLNSVGGGEIIRIEGNIAYVNEDGFETPVLLRECVVVGEASARQKAPAASAPVASKSQAPAAAPKAVPAPVVEVAPEEIPVEETPEGEKLNLTLGFEPHDLKSIGTTPIDMYLVNDSNYFISFTLLSREKSGDEWELIYSGTVEPNIQLLLGELDRSKLPSMDRVAMQYVAYKCGKSFKLKSPASVELNLDTTKFFKLHCYRGNIYFDNPVIALDFVKNDVPCNIKEPKPDAKALEKAMKSKKQADMRVRRPVRKQPKPSVMENGTIVVDLHIHELVDNTNGLSNADMLNMQVDEFRRVMDANLKNKGCRIIFIHGKGEGVLRQALMKELNHRYKGHDVQDASFREYGYGATQVTI